ncbi:hypothetical protein [Rhodobacter capsulatus]|uniref:hypothetical protein n=1 Tax=Rhodobacter capsulatus TaxID=1061 RepID=UPI0003D34E93|nr:hypothetical protein [Rhodobacter capsulatus]ETD81598.1 hypothetical protein U716_10520 [Rhodobacter capsulatus B6]
MFGTALMFGMMVLILSLQLLGGFPPLYRPFGKLPEADLRRLIPHLFLIFPAMAAFVVFNHPILLILPAAVGLWCGWRIRGIIAAERVTPRFVPSWPIFTLYPMLVFDLWTLGGATAFAAFRLL